MPTAAYIRVSSIDQNTDRQHELLPDTDEVFEEKASAATANRPKLDDLITWARKGDHVYVASIDRLARNIVDLHKLVKKITDKGAVITFVKENMVFGNGSNEATSKLLFNILGSFAEFERELIKERQREGIAAAKARGKHMGRPSRLNNDRKAEIVRKHQDGASVSALSKEYGVSRGTIYNVLGPKRRRER